MESGPLFLYAGGMFDCCLLSVLVLYNVFGLVTFLRDDSEESASVMSKAAWGLGVAALFIPPCGVVFALAAIAMANLERRRIYQDISPLVSAGPARMASINGSVALLLYAVLTLGSIVTYMMA
jgi:hypothetical protein